MDIMTAVGESQALLPDLHGSRHESEDAFYARHAGSDGVRQRLATLIDSFRHLTAAIRADRHAPELTPSVVRP